MTIYNYPNGIDPYGETGIGDVLGQRKLSLTSAATYVSDQALNAGNFPSNSVVVVSGTCTIGTPCDLSENSNVTILGMPGAEISIDVGDEPDDYPLKLGSYCYIEGISFAGDTPGIQIYYAGTVFRRCTFERASVSSVGARIFLDDGPMVFDECVFRCQATGTTMPFGGLHQTGYTAFIRGCTFSGDPAGTSVATTTNTGILYGTYTADVPEVAILENCKFQLGAHVNTSSIMSFSGCSWKSGSSADMAVPTAP